MVWVALCLAVVVTVTVWLWGRSALRRSVSHADLQRRPRLPLSTTTDARAETESDVPLGAALQENEELEEEVPQTPELRIARKADGEIATPADVLPAPVGVQEEVLWVEGTIEIEPGLGIVCAKANNYKDELFTQAQNKLKTELNLFLISKNDRDGVLKKECGLLLASRLSDHESNSKIQDAYLLGVPVLLAEDVGECMTGDLLKVYFSPAGLEEYQRVRAASQANWELVSYQLQGNDRYFLTHSDAGYKLLSSLEVYLKETLGSKQEIKSQTVPKGKQIDFVIVPTLRTTSSKFISVLSREIPVLAIRSSDMEGCSVGDEVPAWRWKGGEFYSYPPLKRNRIGEPRADTILHQ